MSLFKPVILFDVMQIVSSDGNGSMHFVRQNDTFEDSASDGDVGGEWALVVDVLAFDSGLGSLEAYNKYQVNMNTLYLPSPIFL